MNLKVKRAVKINSQEGDGTPEGTIIYIFAEIIIPQELRDNRPEGIMDASKMYYALIPNVEYNTKVPVAIVDSKAQILSEDLEDFEIQTVGLKEYLNGIISEIESLGFKLYE